jgi:DNA polymerase-4
VVPPDFSKYAEASEKVFAVFHEFTPLVEGLSLDEAFLDVTASQALLGSPLEQARKLKARIRERTGLTASVGIADVKFAAKIASDLSKPDGLLEVPTGTTRSFLAPLPVSRLWGVGPRTEELLLRLGLRTIGDVALAEETRLERELGSGGAHLRALSLGNDPRPVEPGREAKSVGAEETFEEDLADIEELLPMLHGQAVRVAARLRHAGLKAGCVSLKIKYANFRVVSRQEQLPTRTDDGGEIYRSAARLLGRVELRPIRLTGVHASDLGGDESQLGLFDRARRERQDRLNKSLDAIAARYGRQAVLPADLLSKKKRP